MKRFSQFWRTRFAAPERAFLLEVLASPLGRNLYIPAFFGVWIFASGFIFPEEFYYGISVHVLDALSLPVSFGVFALAKLIKNHRSQSLLNFTVWLSAGIASAASPVIFLLVVTGHLNEKLLGQFPIGIVSYSTLISVSALINAGIRLSRARLREVKQHQDLLVKIRGELEEQIETMKVEIKNSVDSELAKALEAVKVGTSPKALSERLFAAIDEVIRPLSHKLSGLGLSTTPPMPSTDYVPIARRTKGVALSRLAAPEIYFLLFVIFILPASSYVQGVFGLAVNFGVLLLHVAVLMVIERIATTFYLHRLLAMLLLAVLAGLVGSLYSLIVSETADTGISIGYVTISLSVSGLMALVSKRLDDLNRLAIVNQEIQAVVAVLRQEAWVTKTRLAKAIHGSVQAKFLAVALRIANAPKLTKAELASARKDIESSIIDVDSSILDKSATFNNQLKIITDAWDGVVNIRVKSEKSTIKLINQYPLARTCLLEVIGEAVSNAAKHSKAPIMDIELQENELNQVVVSVWSAGRLANRSGRKGYGSQMLDEVTSSWSLTNLKGRVYLRAVIPLAK